MPFTDSIGALEQAQLGGPREAYDKLIARAAERSLDIYLQAAQGLSALGDVDTGELLRFGELAKVVKIIKTGELTLAVKLTGIGATAGAKAAVEAAGGSFV